MLLSSCAAAEEAPKLNVDEIAASTTQFQAEILADGEVSAAEYEKALLAQRQCVIDAGATPGELVDAGNNERTFDYQVSAPSDGEREIIEAKAEECLGEFFDDIAQVWAYQQLLTADEREELRPKVVECLNKAGLAVPSDADLKKIAEVLGSDESKLEMAAPCFEKYPGYFFVAPDEGDLTSDGESH